MSETTTTIETLNKRVQMDWRDKPGQMLDISAWMPSEIKAITPLVDRLLQLVKESQCFAGDHLLLETGLREALYSMVIHGDGHDSAKSIQVHCISEQENAIHIVVKDQKQKCDSKSVLRPLVAKSLSAEHRPGILQMMHSKDALRFERRGAEVHVWIESHTRSASEAKRQELYVPSLSAERGCASRSWYSDATLSSRRTGD